jgi:hypothetical protein
MSGLAADPYDSNILYAVEDSFFLKSRIFVIDTSSHPALLVDDLRIRDDNDVMAALDVVDLADPDVADDDPTRVDVFDEADLDAIINDDKTINIDPEGISVDPDGGFWVVSEGSGTVGDPGRPLNSLNFLIKTDDEGVIEQVVTLPSALNDNQLRFGFEGVTVDGDLVYVAFQRVWSGAGDDNVRIGIYDTVGDDWAFVFYELDAAESQNGGWVGLSDITALGGGQFLVLERDNQGGPDAAIKRLYLVDGSSLSPGDTIAVDDKVLVRDLLPDLAAAGGLPAEKVEGSTVTIDGDVWIINDNDGVDDNSGETQLINLGAILTP